jgi:hypothetical protein
VLGVRACKALGRGTRTLGTLAMLTFSLKRLLSLLTAENLRIAHSATAANPLPATCALFASPSNEIFVLCYRRLVDGERRACPGAEGGDGEPRRLFACCIGVRGG